MVRSNNVHNATTSTILFQVSKITQKSLFQYMLFSILWCVMKAPSLHHRIDKHHMWQLYIETLMGHTHRSSYQVQLQDSKLLACWASLLTVLRWPVSTHFVHHVTASSRRGTLRDRTECWSSERWCTVIIWILCMIQFNIRNSTPGIYRESNST